MIVKLLPDQVAKHWKPIRRAIEESLPPVSEGAENRMEKILEALMIGEMQCWISHNSEGRVDNILTTSVTHDKISDTKSLMIFSIFGFDTDIKSWGEGLTTLVRFARGKGCSRIIGYTKIDSVAKFVERIGGDASYRFVTIPID
jgi:hypothetical protein